MVQNLESSKSSLSNPGHVFVLLVSEYFSVASVDEEQQIVNVVCLFDDFKNLEDLLSKGGLWVKLLVFL